MLAENLLLGSETINNLSPSPLQIVASDLQESCCNGNSSSSIIL